MQCLCHIINQAIFSLRIVKMTYHSEIMSDNSIFFDFD